jgi:hypothetical protein
MKTFVVLHRFVVSVTSMNDPGYTLICIETFKGKESGKWGLGVVLLNFYLLISFV